MKRSLKVFFVVATIAAVSSIDYCRMNCTINGDSVKHIACNNDGEFDRACPQNVKLIDMDESLIAVFVDQHNSFRNFVAGGGNSTYKYRPACRMATIQWDDELAANAVLNVKKCKEEHDFCHGTVAFPESSSALYQTYASHGNIYEIINFSTKVWSSSILKYQHVSDLLVDRNIRLGCAISAGAAKFEDNFFYEENKVNSESEEYWITCNYATNIHQADSMYIECDVAGDGCQTGRNSKYANLCSKDE